MKILIVEDDKNLADMLKKGLSAEMYAVEVVHDGAEGSFLGRNYDYDSIILDYSLPKKDGLTICREIRSSGKTSPIIFLSANDDVEIKVSAFKEGADDYMTKPFSLAELYARLQVINKRSVDKKTRRSDNSTRLQVGNLTLDVENQTFEKDGKNVRLTKKEFIILEYLIRHKGSIVSRILLIEHAWTVDSDLLSNTVDTHIRNLRKKIHSTKKPVLIANVPGRGYIIDTTDNLKAKGIY